MLLADNSVMVDQEETEMRRLARKRQSVGSLI
jgi:hypothetical protein